MRIAFAPNYTGSGHNTRALSLIQELHRASPDCRTVVYCGSLQNTFRELFATEGATVIDVGEQPNTNTAKQTLIGTQMNWNGYVRDYAAPAFVNGVRVLRFLAEFSTDRPDVVVSDYNISASIAAIILNIPHVLTTERYDFSLQQLSNEDLRDAGFTVDESDMDAARKAMHALFVWVVHSSQLILTDKPYIPSMDDGTAIADAIEAGVAKFVGPMVRRPPRSSAHIRERMGIGSGPLVVISVSGTTMFRENKAKIIEQYVAAFSLLRRDIPDLEIVLIGWDDVEVPPGMHVLRYFPEWMALLQEADLLVSAPGWITATEAAALEMRALFVLPGFDEYHEIEAARRLGMLGYPTLVAPGPENIAGAVIDALSGSATDWGEAIRSMAPEGRGTATAASLILDVARQAGAPQNLSTAPQNGLS